MGLISITPPSDGQTIDAADVATPLNTIVNEINGLLDNANIVSGAAISGTKLADNSIPAGKLGDSSVETADYSDGSIKPEHLVTGTGTSWVYRDWTPTWGGISLGNGADNSKYLIIGKTLICEAIIDFGTTTAVNGNITISDFPATIDTRYASDNVTIAGEGVIMETGIGYYPCIAEFTGGSTIASVRFAENISVAAVRPIEYSLATNTQYKPFSDASGAGGNTDGIYIKFQLELA